MNIQYTNCGAIFSSDLHRAHRTAEIIKLERELVIQTSKALRERTYGSWEGKLGEDYRKNFQHLFDKVKELSEKEQKKFRFADDIENDEQVIGRFITQLREISVAYPNKTVLVVTHGGCIRTFLMHIGYVKYGELPVGSFSNAGYAKITSCQVPLSLEWNSERFLCRWANTAGGILIAV